MQSQLPVVDMDACVMGQDDTPAPLPPALTDKATQIQQAPEPSARVISYPQLGSKALVGADKIVKQPAPELLQKEQPGHDLDALLRQEGGLGTSQ